MLIWIGILGGLAIAALAISLLALAVSRAERRARRALYQALGLGQEIVDLLMARNGDVLSELSLIRLDPSAAQATPAELAARLAAARPRPNIRLVHPAETAGDKAAARGGDRSS